MIRKSFSLFTPFRDCPIWLSRPVNNGFAIQLDHKILPICKSSNTQFDIRLLDVPNPFSLIPQTRVNWCRFH